MSAAEALRAAIEQCYAAFAGEPRPRRLDASPVHDADAILRTLSSAPLRELTGDQLGPYSGSAMTTVGTEQDYRHFLPRILELAVGDPGWLGAEPPIVARKIEMAGWREWPSEQQSAVRRFFRAAFDAAIEFHPDEEMQSVEDWLCALIQLGESPTEMLERWRASGSPNAALQMASLIRHQSRHLHRHEQVGGGFWEFVDDGARRGVAYVLTSEETKGFLEGARGEVDEDRFLFIDAALCELQRQY